MIGIAVLGGGIFAREAHLPALKEVPEFSLKAVWSRSHASASSVQKAAVDLSFPSSSEIQVYCENGGSSSGNLDALLARDDINTVVLSLPIPSQPDIIRKCFDAGKNVISEKPVAKDVKHSVELIELWEKEYKPKGVQWIIAEQFPYEPAFVKAREVLETGAIGELRSFEMQWLNWMPQDGKYYLTEWRTKPEYQGGFILDGGVHFVAALRWMLGGLGYKIASLSATSSQQQEHLPPVDTVHSLVRLAPLSSGGSSTTASGSVVLSVGHERPDTPFYIYRGSKATLKVQLGAALKVEIDSIQNKQDKIWTVTLLGEKGEVLQEHGFDSIGVKEEMKAFGKALAGLDKGDKQAMEVVMQKSGPRAALKDVDVIEGMLTSADQEQWIKLQQ